MEEQLGRNLILIKMYLSATNAWNLEKTFMWGGGGWGQSEEGMIEEVIG